ncbi:MAG TPA: thioredoxin [Phycisphaerae bacterium]|nr:thioredoxin [Phycisphaerae bacterium]
MLRLILGPLIGAAAGAAIGYLGKCRGGACPLTGNPFTGALFGALIGAMAVGAFSCRRDAGAEENSRFVRRIESAEDFDKTVLKASQPVVVDFYATWCGPCKLLAPRLAELAEQYQTKALFAKVDVDKLPGLADAHRVRALPTVVLFNNGQEVRRWVGVQDADAYRREIDSLLSK